ncbi:hypothetical protein A3D80_03210 [Candidatus Roizmanbacteria bacterium RIFCSPHIGHO2_02_FULL_40_13b]|uniref:DNA 3'-5' helicase n=1 Tax=Candidatus Roizmanbacteria bacterium RIFCSPHIGHO2_01_FULL_39_24 TaxID=1802032 RepID=A0A1F7GKZ6_9BACT|nr:MAG: hypothetical protein A2799_00955 [Candidatus Roizmanbacteria bacterium RIFCSPHIGHO2_01_FULL_39_24]OGK26976.1 MAG: hypothetical protein A3D80_03210 [Candidatus Roizmanbacteria bacterium RIFCSPHIGHO2_02_FULL_40_13b]OGK48869.1 MAG: hypothetical protein A3A56_01515 [Candidatus Roizmanbacteria bacterium RIFCSPLOWO2_01_FULL_40_32]
MKCELFNELNEAQKKAVMHTSGPSLILAGAGSGKTRVLIKKVVNLIKNDKVPQSSIILITFTNKAAGEMKERLYKEEVTIGFVGTFHSFCVRVLRRYGAVDGIGSNFVIYDRDDQENLIKKVLVDQDIDKRYTGNFFLGRISSAKDELISPEKYAEMFKDFIGRMVGPVYSAYQKRLEKNNAVDFDDLIYKTVMLFDKHPEILDKYHQQFKYILVDEFQDTNFAQYQLTRQLGKKENNVTIVGDFSQSIYSWRGAQIRNLEKFKENFENCETFYLKENYRSTQNILDFAYNVINQNHTHPILKVFTQKGRGELVEIEKLDNEEYEGLYVAGQIENLVQGGECKYQDFAVLYRINAQSRAVEESFLHMGIPYVLIGGTRFYERKEIKDLLSYMRLVMNPDDEISSDRAVKIGKRRFEQFEKVYELYKDKLEEADSVDILDAILLQTKYGDLYNGETEEDFSRLENIKELRVVATTHNKIGEFLEQVALVESEYSQNEKTLRQAQGKKGVHLMTLHQAKGLEFPFVFIIGLEEGILPHSRSVDDLYELEEERRLFYVGITRAMRKLFITYVGRRFAFGRSSYAQVSRFIDESRELEG